MKRMMVIFLALVFVGCSIVLAVSPQSGGTEVIKDEGSPDCIPPAAPVPNFGQLQGWPQKALGSGVGGIFSGGLSGAHSEAQKEREDEEDRLRIQCNQATFQLPHNRTTHFVLGSSFWHKETVRSSRPIPGSGIGPLPTWACYQERCASCYIVHR